MSHNFDTLIFQNLTPQFDDLQCKSVISGFVTSLKISCHAFLIHPKCTVERHVTHTRNTIIGVGSNHLFCSKTRLQKWSFGVKVSRVASASKSNVSKTSLLTDRGYPPLFQKHEIPLLSRIGISHGDRSMIQQAETFRRIIEASKIRE